MSRSPHTFHIPVMGTGFSIDTPLRVARFGIASVMSVVDDTLIERVRRRYCQLLGVAYEPIPARAPDSRARRITAWLDFVADQIDAHMAHVKGLPFVTGNDKTKYFELLPGDSPLRRAYDALVTAQEGSDMARTAAELTESMVSGSADVNIMTKLDRVHYDHQGVAFGPEYADAKSALRGFANSRIESNLVLSAGMNPTLFGYLESFPDFYRDGEGRIRKGIILKVSDFRSALVQGKFLAKKGIEIRECRIESGLNCGGHAFATDGELLGPILQQFRDGRGTLAETFEPMVRQYYLKKGLPYVGQPQAMRVTVQGGIGTFGEVRRLHDHYGVDATGWATPFLLVPEATALDDVTRRQLAAAKEEDLYLSNVSPLGVPFNNLRGSSSEVWTARLIDEGRPGSSCPRGYLSSNTEFSTEAICTASREYQKAKLESLGFSTPPRSDTADPRIRAVYDKTCICSHLGNGALIDLGIGRPSLPVAVCPGPNIAYFDRLYSLREMVDHIYGRGPSLVPGSRPHMFANELAMNVDQFVRLAEGLAPGDSRGLARLATTKANLDGGLEHYRALVKTSPFVAENLASLGQAIDLEGARVERAWCHARGLVEAPAPSVSCVGKT
jgi:hypothetical protein